MEDIDIFLHQFDLGMQKKKTQQTSNSTHSKQKNTKLIQRHEIKSVENILPILPTPLLPPTENSSSATFGDIYIPHDKSCLIRPVARKSSKRKVIFSPAEEDLSITHDLIRKSNELIPTILQSPVQNKEKISVQEDLIHSVSEIQFFTHNIPQSVSITDELLTPRHCYCCTCPISRERPIHIPTGLKNHIKEEIMYGNFCSLPCALSYLQKEDISSSIRYERETLLY